MTPRAQPLPLTGYRVLDLTTESAHLAGKLLADLGCQVIKVEPPSGDPARRKDTAGTPTRGARTGLFWLAYNTGKLGVTLDARTAAGRRLLERLVERADFLIESSIPGEPTAFDGSRWAGLNPRLVIASITPFGEGGPYRDYRDGELIAQAAGGLLFLSGADESRPPVRLGVEMAWHMAAAQAVAAMLIAHQQRSATGQGQHIDLSVQEAVTNLLFKAPLAWELNGIVDGRWPSPSAGGARRTGIWPCEDGYVSWVWWVARGWGRKNVPLLQWMAEESDVDDLLAVDWEALSITTVPKDLARRFESAAGEFFLRHTKAELYEQAVQRRFILYPVNSPRDVLADSQLEARDYWQSIVDPDSGTVLTHPGAWFKSAEYLPRARGPAPRLGEHNRYVFQGMLGLSNQELVTLKATGAM